MSDIFVDEAALKNLARELLTADGAEYREASVVADILLWCDRMGRPNYGVWRLPNLTKRLSLGLIKSPCHPRFVKTASAAGILDGDHGFGTFVADTAMQHAVELAQHSGIGVVGVNNSNHFGAGAFFLQRAIEANMISVVLSNSFPHVAALGGLTPVIGTNPFAFGAPRENGRSILIDMSTGPSAGTAIVRSREANTELPEGIAIDEQGRPTRDPHQVACLLPFGGAKGYCLGIMVELLSGVLTSAGIAHGVKSTLRNFHEACNNGHLFLAVDIAAFMPLETYYARMAIFTDLLLASGPSGAEGSVQLPGEHRWLARDRSLRHGIPLDVQTVRSLQELASKAGLAVPW